MTTILLQRGTIWKTWFIVSLFARYIFTQLWEQSKLYELDAPIRDVQGPNRTCGLANHTGLTDI